MMVNEEIKKLRKTSGMTQLELAELVGVSLSCVRSWEQGQRNCPGPMWRLIKIMVESKNQ
jgi:DNA-binding transcriptional regulator YiaG